MPSAHRRYAEWTPAKMMSEAALIGPAAIALVEAIMKAKPHPEQGFRSCLGIISLKRFPSDLNRGDSREDKDGRVFVH
jgi:transposase